MKVVKRLLSIVLKTLFWLLLALVVFFVSLFFRSQRLPASLVCRAAAAFLPDRAAGKTLGSAGTTLLILPALLCLVLTFLPL